MNLHKFNYTLENSILTIDRYISPIERNNITNFTYQGILNTGHYLFKEGNLYSMYIDMDWIGNRHKLIESVLPIMKSFIREYKLDLLIT